MRRCNHHHNIPRSPPSFTQNRCFRLNEPSAPVCGRHGVHNVQVSRGLTALESAKAKVRSAAAHYERSRSGGASVFSDTKSLTPQEIAYKLKFAFGIKLTKSELKALVALFDRDGDGHIDNAEFQVAFFRLANEGKEEYKQNTQKRMHAIQSKAKHIETTLTNQLKKRSKVRCATVWPCAAPESRLSHARWPRVLCLHRRGCVTTRRWIWSAFSRLWRPWQRRTTWVGRRPLDQH